MTIKWLLATLCLYILRTSVFRTLANPRGWASFSHEEELKPEQVHERRMEMFAEHRKN